MHTEKEKLKDQVPHVATGRVRTSISLSATAQERGRALMAAEGFPNFSEMVEYLIRRTAEQKAA